MSAGNSHNGSHSNEGGALGRIWSQKFSFLATFALVFLVTILVCVITGFVPNPSKAPEAADAQADSSSQMVTITTSPLVVGPAAATQPVDNVNMRGELPTKISIPRIGMNVSISNPNTTSVATLDQYLLKGAVRYPTSATLGEQGNVILFGHSSYLPVVHNQAFKAFDGIQNLKKGDQITVYSNQHKYVYAVDSVQQMSATSDAIPLTSTGYTLTLATCDSFGKKTDRFVVTATLVGSYALGS
jgi:LPXTG-site transpeptidase (sortase) family protein